MSPLGRASTGSFAEAEGTLEDVERDEDAPDGLLDEVEVAGTAEDNDVEETLGGPDDDVFLNHGNS